MRPIEWSYELKTGEINISNNEKIQNSINDLLNERTVVSKLDHALEQNKYFGDLYDMEASREDIIVKVSDLKPMPVNPSGPVGIKYQEEEFFLQDLALNQYLDCSPAGLRNKEFQFFRSQKDLPVFDKSGQAVENSDFAFNYLMHVPASRPEMERVFRAVDDKVHGFVGKDYPLWFSDYQAVTSMVKAYGETNGSLTIDRPRTSRLGTIHVPFFSPEKKLQVKKANGRTDTLQMGGYYTRNPNGGGVLGIGGYAYREVCTNGMMGWVPTEFNRIANFNESYFNKELGILLQAFLPELIEDEPAYSQMIDDLLEGTRPGDNMYEDFYSLFGKASIKMIDDAYDYMSGYIIDGSQMVLKNYAEEIKAQANYFSMKRQTEYLVTLAQEDPTIDTDEFSLWDMANLFTAHANKSEMDADKSVELREKGFKVLINGPLTPLISS